jgi:alanine racemase
MHDSGASRNWLRSLVGQLGRPAAFPEARGDCASRPDAHGASPRENAGALDLWLQPVMTLKSEIIAIQQIKRGDIVGCQPVPTDCNMRIGVVAVTDGYPRHAPTARRY